MVSELLPKLVDVADATHRRAKETVRIVDLKAVVVEKADVAREELARSFVPRMPAQPIMCQTSISGTLVLWRSAGWRKRVVANVDVPPSCAQMRGLANCSIQQKPGLRAESPTADCGNDVHA